MAAENDWGVTLDAVRKARAAFERNEPRDLFYRAAVYLVGEALRGNAPLSVAEALAVLLQTWNRAYYRYYLFDSDHFSAIEHLLAEHQGTLAAFRKRRIEGLERSQDLGCVLHVFRCFEEVLGPVGAAKSLHLLAPQFFPLWDRAIAKAYGLRLGPRGTNARRYWDFMAITREQALHLHRSGAPEGNVLKAIDEYNYCHHTKGWI